MSPPDRRDDAHAAQRLSEFGSVAQMIVPEACERRAPLRIVEPVYRGLIGVDGVKIELNEVGEQGYEIGFQFQRW